MYNNYNSHVSGSSYFGSRDNVMGRMNDQAAVGLLQHLSKEDLQSLMNDDSKLNDLVQDLAQVRSVQTDHDDLVAQNKSLAEYNLSMQPRLDSLKTDVATGYETINRLKTDLGLHKAKLDQFVGNRKLDTLHALLQTAAAEVEEESETLAEQFCNKGVSLEDFLSSYVPKRKEGHKRRIKAEKMGEILKDGAMSHCYAGGPPNPGYPAGPSGHSHVPYPVGGGYGMPQPSLYRP